MSIIQVQIYQRSSRFGKSNWTKSLFCDSTVAFFMQAKHIYYIKSATEDAGLFTVNVRLSTEYKCTENALYLAQKKNLACH